MIAAVICIAILGPVKAQVIRGGFGYGYVGLAMNISPDIQHDLSASAILGSGLRLNRPGILGGGGGYGVLGKRILLGGSGSGYRIADATSRGQATLSTGGGFVNLGYLISIRQGSFAYPYIGIGGRGMRLSVKNTTDELFDVGGKVVAPGESIRLNCGGIGFEAGYGIQFLTFSMAETGSCGGLMVGLQVGTYVFAAIEDWHEGSSNDMIPAFSEGYSIAPYIRLTIGGGGFSIAQGD